MAKSKRAYKKPKAKLGRKVKHKQQSLTLDLKSKEPIISDWAPHTPTLNGTHRNAT